MALVADADTLCRRAGAVNTLRSAGDRWEGCNTDVPGFLDALCVERGRDLSGWRAVILGAGGAARGVAVALAQAGADVTICARRREQARQVARLVGVASGAWPPSGGSWHLLVNTTPVGTAPAADASPLPAAALDGSIVYDLVYNPQVTRLLADAERRGCRTIGGLGMLVAQAERQFAWWTGVQPAPGLFRAAAERGFEVLGTA